MKRQHLDMRLVSLSKYSNTPYVVVTLDRLGPLYQVRVDGAMTWYLSFPHAQAEFNRQILGIEERVHGD